jgi:hypothetical protein
MFEDLVQFLGETQHEQFVGDMDAATEKVLGAMEPHISADAAAMDHSVGFHCIDGRMAENGDIKIIDFQCTLWPTSLPHGHANCSVGIPAV